MRCRKAGRYGRIARITRVFPLLRLRRSVTSSQLGRIRLGTAASEGARGGPVASLCRRRCAAAFVARGANGVALVANRVRTGPRPVVLPADNPRAGARSWRGGGIRRERRVGHVRRARSLTVTAPNERVRQRSDGLASAGGSLRASRAWPAQGGSRSSKVLLGRARRYVAMPPRFAAPARRQRRNRVAGSYFIRYPPSTVESAIPASDRGPPPPPGCPRRRRMAHRERGRSRVFVFVYDIGLRQGCVPGSACARARRFGDRGRNGRRVRAPIRQRESGGAFMALKRAAAPP